MVRWDFFICCSEADRDWGNWLDWQLRALGLKTFFEPLDVQPGNNIALEIQRALTEAERTLVVLSPQLRSHTVTETAWASTFAADPDGAKAKLVPVRIADFAPSGLFAAIKYIDLVERDRDDAARLLRSGLFPEPRPTDEPKFPGSKSTPAEPLFPGAAASTPPRHPGEARAAHPAPPSGTPSPHAETIAALLDKHAQAREVLRALPRQLRLANGKTEGFLLAGHYEEWPEALRHRLFIDLDLPADTDVFVPVQGKELEDWIPMPELLRELLATKLLADGPSQGAPRETLEQRIIAHLAQPRRARIFYRVLYPHEARNTERVAELLLTWKALGQQLPPSAPSHVLLLLYAPRAGTTEGSQLAALIKQLTRVFRKRGLTAAVLPTLVSPQRDDVTPWAQNHLPAPWQDEVLEQVIDAFADRDAMPHGELKRHVLRILKPFIERRQ